MKSLLATIVLSIFGVGYIHAQDDIYDAPEPARVVVHTPRASQSYSNADDDYDYNPNYDYQYSRRLNRMYNDNYFMPSSAYFNMWGYPSFSSFYNPWMGWGGSGFSIMTGNSWGNPYAWNSPYYWNSWNSPWGYNSWNNPYMWGGGGYGYYNPYYGGYGYNSFYNPYYYSSFYSPNWGYYGGSRYVNRNYSNVPLPSNRTPRPTRYPNNGGFGTFSRPSSGGNSTQMGGGQTRPTQQAPVIRNQGGNDYYQQPVDRYQRSNPTPSPSVSSPAPVQRNSGGGGGSFGSGGNSGGGGTRDGGGRGRGRF